MDELPLNVWQANFKDKQHYLDFRARWSKLCSPTPYPGRPELTPTHYLVYAALRGRDWRRGFTPITNPHKLANGGRDDQGWVHALRALHSTWSEKWIISVFDGLVTSEMLARVRAMVPTWDWSNGPYPSKLEDAYVNVPDAP